MGQLVHVDVTARAVTTFPESEHDGASRARTRPRSAIAPEAPRAQSSSAGAEQVLTSAGSLAQQATGLRTAVDGSVREVVA
jgi:hypothetical protein